MNIQTATEKFNHIFFAKNGYKAIPGKEKREDGKVIFKYSAMGREVNVDDYKYHLTTDIGLTPAPAIDDQCYFGALDIDSYNLTEKEKIQLVRQARELYLVPSYTKSKGLHLWCIASDKVSCSSMRGYLKHCIEQLRLPKNTEVFPKQTNTKKGKGIGNGITLPYRNYFNKKENSPKGIDVIDNKITEIDIDAFISNCADNEILVDTFKNYDDFVLAEDGEITQEDINPGSINDPEMQKLTSSEIWKKIVKEKMSLLDNKSFCDDMITLYVGKRVGNYDTDNAILASLEPLEIGAGENYFEDKISKARSSIGIDDPYKARNKMLENVIYIKQRDKYFDLSTQEEYKAEAINFEFSRLFKKELPTSFIKRNPKRKSVEDWIFDPASYKQDEPIITIDGKKYLNAYQPNTLIPAKGDISLWNELLNHIFNGNQDNIDIFLDWLAFQIQNPGVKIRWAIILVTTNFQTGKGSIWRTIKLMLGNNNAKEIDVGQALDKSKGYLTNSQIVLIDEMQSVGTFGERQELLNQLKRIITEDYVSSRALYVDYKIIKSCTNYILFSNHKDALSLPKNEVRYWPIINERQRLSDDFYKRYHAWLDDGGAKAVLYDLQNRDITDDFNPKGIAPKSAFLDTMSSAGEHPLTRTVRQYFDELEFPFTEDREVIGSRELFDWLQHHRLLGRAKINDVATALEAIGGKCLGQCRVTVAGQTKRPTLYQIRNFETHHGKTNQEIAELWSPLQKEDGGGIV